MKVIVNQVQHPEHVWLDEWLQSKVSAGHLLTAAFAIWMIFCFAFRQIHRSVNQDNDRKGQKFEVPSVVYHRALPNPGTAKELSDWFHSVDVLMEEEMTLSIVLNHHGTDGGDDEEDVNSVAIKANE
eukprot:GHVH01003807.1.p1 GENE.GHVH01003807.1~~GHVH01003807.1.p1  ORF type:complete len:127 (+),score=21.77 GHVH01003807.1:42-422(+)